MERREDEKKDADAPLARASSNMSNTSPDDSTDYAEGRERREEEGIKTPQRERRNDLRPISNLSHQSRVIPPIQSLLSHDPFPSTRDTRRGQGKIKSQGDGITDGKEDLLKLYTASVDPAESKATDRLIEAAEIICAKKRVTGKRERVVHRALAGGHAWFLSNGDDRNDPPTRGYVALYCYSTRVSYSVLKEIHSLDAKEVYANAKLADDKIRRRTEKRKKRQLASSEDPRNKAGGSVVPHTSVKGHQTPKLALGVRTGADARAVMLFLRIIKATSGGEAHHIRSGDPQEVTTLGPTTFSGLRNYRDTLAQQLAGCLARIQGASKE